MSNWSDTQITAKGRALDAKVTAGATTLVFTKMQLGSGIVVKALKKALKASPAQP